MNVKELIEELKKYPEDMEIIYSLNSDYEILTKDDLETAKGVNKGFYVMRSHPTMSEENKAKEKEYLWLG